MEEIWKPIPGYEGRYEVSSRGRVKSFARDPQGRILRPGTASSGYPSVALGRRNTRNVHILVALTFIGPCPRGQEVRHIDGNRENPRASNLRYGTRRDNIEDARRYGTLRQGHEKHRKVAQPMRELACRLYSSGGFSQAHLARLFGMSSFGILHILRCGI